MVITEKLESGRELPMALKAMETLLKIDDDKGEVLQSRKKSNLIRNTNYLGPVLDHKPETSLRYMLFLYT